MAEITIETIRTLATAAGLSIPDERLPLVLQQYRGFLRAIDRLEALNLPRETEPATTFELPLQPPASGGAKGPRP